MSPVSPVSPVSPESPVSLVSLVSPVSPVSPVSLVSLVSLVRPVNPVSPVSMASPPIPADIPCTVPDNIKSTLPYVYINIRIIRGVVMGEWHRRCCSGGMVLEVL